MIRDYLSLFDDVVDHVSVGTVVYSTDVLVFQPHAFLFFLHKEQDEHCYFCDGDGDVWGRIRGKRRVAYLFELLFGDEVVVDSVCLVRFRLSSRGRNTQLENSGVIFE